MGGQGNFRYRRLTRQIYDNRLRALGPASRYSVPRGGWIRTIRIALNIPAVELGSRMGVTDASVRAMELTEASGGIRLNTLRRAAEAMDCKLAYVFLPTIGLEQTVVDRKRAKCEARRARCSSRIEALDDEAYEWPDEC